MGLLGNKCKFSKYLPRAHCICHTSWQVVEIMSERCVSWLQARRTLVKGQSCNYAAYTGGPVGSVGEKEGALSRHHGIKDSFLGERPPIE